MLWRRFSIAMTALAVAAGGLMAWNGWRPLGRHSIGTNRPATSSPSATITRIDLGGIPIRQPLAAEGGLWTIVEDRKNDSLFLLRVDAESAVWTRVPFGRVRPKLLAAGFGAIWVAGCPHEDPSTNCKDGVVYRVDPETARITARVRIGSNITALAAGEGAVWVGRWTYVNGSPQPAALLRLDPKTLALRRYSLQALAGKQSPCCVHSLAAGEGAVWMAFGDSALLVRMDLGSLAFTRLTAYGIELAEDTGAVWLEGRTSARATSAVEGTLRIDPTTNEVAIKGPIAASVATGNGQVWVVEGSRDINDRTFTLERLDPATGVAIGPAITLEAGPPKVNFDGGILFRDRVGLAYEDGLLWLTVADSFEAIRIAPQ